jgi:hypothetical protein
MRAFRKLPLIPIAFMLASSAFGQTVKPPFSLTISAAKPTVKSGSYVFIKATQTNISDQTIGCSSTIAGSSNLSYIYNVRDENGNSLEQRTGVFSYGGSVRLCDLDPGKTKTEDLLISWLYNLSKPGKYTIQVIRPISSNGADGVVKSNTITITVTP